MKTAEEFAREIWEADEDVEAILTEIRRLERSAIEPITINLVYSIGGDELQSELEALGFTEEEIWDNQLSQLLDLTISVQINSDGTWNVVGTNGMI